MLCVWSVDDKGVVHSWHNSAMNGPVAKIIIIFFSSNSCWWVRCTKFGCLVENRARYLEQYLFRFCAQRISLFLSIMLNWSIEGNFTIHTWKKPCGNSPWRNFRQKETMGAIIVKRELLETSNRAIYWTSPLLMSPIRPGTTKHSCVLNVLWKKSHFLHVTCDCRASTEIRFILSELYFMELSDTKNFLASKVYMFLSKGRKGTYKGMYGERIDEHPLLQSLSQLL